MKNSFYVLLLIVFSFSSFSVFSQSKDEPVSLGLPGDDLDLYAVLEVFQKSKTIEDFEKTINLEKSKLNNLDLDKDKKVDFIKVVTNKDGDSFSFILQVAVSKTENQDVAVIFVSKDKSGKVAMQIVGDEDLYGKDYVIEPKGSSSGSTANPGYTGGNSGETMNLPAAAAPTTTVVVQSAPIVQYVYSPAYVPYYPPYYYGYYPPYYFPFVPIARAIFWSNNYHCHGGYYGGYHGSVNINVNNVNHYNNYNNNSRNRSNTVANNKANGNYGNRAATNNNMNRGNSASTRPPAGNSASTRPSTGNNSATRPSTRPTSPSAGNNSSTRPSTRPTSPSASNRQSSGSSNYSRPSSSSNSYNRSSNGSSNRSSYGGGSSNRSSYSGGSSNRGSYGGGGRSGGFSGGGGRGGRR